MADKRTLTVSMRAETAHLRKGINESVGLLKGLQRTSSQTANIVRGAAAVMAGGFLFNKMEQGIRSTISAFGETATMIEDTKHLSEALGTTTEEIQVLQRAAAFAEVDVDMLNRNLKIMTKNLGAASMGTGPAKDALDDLGLSAQSLIRMSLTEQLEAIAGRMNKLGTTAQKASVAASIFGKSGMDMIPFLSAGGEQLSELRTQMEATGELFSNFEASAVDDMGDSMGRLRGIFQAFKNQLVIQLAPAVQYITEMMQRFAASFGGAKPLMTRAINYAVSGMAKLLDGAQKLYGMWFKIKGTVLLVAAGISKTFGVIGSVIGGLITGDLTQLGNVFSMITNTFKLGLLEAINALAKGMDFVLSKMGMETGAANFTESMINNTKFDLSLLGMVIGKNAFGQEFTNSLSQSAGQAFTDAAKVADSSGWGDKFKTKWAEMMGGAAGGDGVDIRKAMELDTFDIVEPLKKEQEIREGIADTMKETADYAKEIKDFGEGTSYRTGEYSARVGGVSGGVGGGVMNNAVGMSAAGTTATSSGNTRTGADNSIPLLQGILDATRMTAMNTQRSPVAVLG